MKLSDLRAEIARSVRDESSKTFDVDDLNDIVTEGLTEVGLAAPHMFQEDITPTANTLAYVVQSADFADGSPDIDLMSVEVWDTTQTPNQPIKFMQAASSQPISGTSDAGWRMWNGTLEIDWNSWHAWLEDHETERVIRVWGYAPWPPIDTTDDNAIVPVSGSLLQALLICARFLAFERLMSSRALFTQWQTAANNTDVSLAGLNAIFTTAQERWKRKQRQIYVTRQAPG